MGCFDLLITGVCVWGEYLGVRVGRGGVQGPLSPGCDCNLNEQLGGGVSPGGHTESLPCQLDLFMLAHLKLSSLISGFHHGADPR